MTETTDTTNKALAAPKPVIYHVYRHYGQYTDRYGTEEYGYFFSKTVAEERATNARNEKDSRGRIEVEEIQMEDEAEASSSTKLLKELKGIIIRKQQELSEDTALPDDQYQHTSSAFLWVCIEIDKLIAEKKEGVKE